MNEPNEHEEAKITKPVVKRSKYLVVTLIIMITGVLLFALTPLFLRFLKFDSDIPGVLVFLVGFFMFIVGQIVRLIKKKG